MALQDRFKSAYNAFMGRDAPTVKTYYYGGSGNRIDRTRHRIQNERSIVNSIINRIAVDGASIDLKHVKVDDDGNYLETINDYLNRLLSTEANVDQTGRAFVQDAIYSMLDEGCIALVLTDSTANPKYTDSYEVMEARVGKIGPICAAHKAEIENAVAQGGDFVVNYGLVAGLRAELMGSEQDI